MRIVFMGTPAFAVPVLNSLTEAGHEILAVYTQPDRPAGRGKRLVRSPVKHYALEHHQALHQPQSLRENAVYRKLVSLRPEGIVVAAYGLFVPNTILQLPQLGCFNIHPSLLPYYRGPSPVSAAILNGDNITGVTIIKLDEGVDTGPIITTRETHIGPHENTQELTARLFEIGASLLIEVLPAWEAGDIQIQPQDETHATVTTRLSRKEGNIDWTTNAVQISRQVRAYYPWPGSFTHWEGRRVKITETLPSDEPLGAPPGTVLTLDTGIGIATGHGVLVVKSLQIAGARQITARDFLRGHPDFIGSVLSRNIAPLN